VNEFLAILGAAATPGALFAIGASLAGKSAERMTVAGWLTFCKLVLASSRRGSRSACLSSTLPSYDAAVMIAAAPLPCRWRAMSIFWRSTITSPLSAYLRAILMSTAVSILTVSAVIAWLAPLSGT
jgi:malonate transporter